VGRLPEVVRALRRLPAPVQAIVVAGRDAALAARLCRVATGSAIRVTGYVDDVRTLMAAADLLITKAGGMTLAEALASELPLLLYGSLPGQERRNERFASRAGIALAARSRRDLARLLERALTEPELLEHLRARIRRVRRPDATRRIVDEVLAGSRQPRGSAARSLSAPPPGSAGPGCPTWPRPPACGAGRAPAGAWR
jgi:processive 1,2-diacylglycerol beta-glucosyltransferase